MTGKGRWVAVAALLAVAAALLLSACGGGDSGEPVSFDGSGYPNGDAANRRDASGPIKSSSVEELALAWTLPIEAESAFGSYASPPILSKA